MPMGRISKYIEWEEGRGQDLGPRAGIRVIASDTRLGSKM